MVSSVEVYEYFYFYFALDCTKLSSLSGRRFAEINYEDEDQSINIRYIL